MSAHDDWLNSGNPLDKPEPSLTEEEIQRVKDLLTDIADQVEEEPHIWTKGATSRRVDFSPARWDSEDAVCWDVKGLLLREMYCFDDGDLLAAAAEEALKEACGTSIYCYNNGLLKPEQFVKWVREAAESL